MKPITVSAQQHIQNANRSVAQAIASMQHMHGQVTPKLLTQSAILAGQVATLRKLTAP